MVRMGLVRKTRDLKRRNIIRIALTEKGQKALECSLRREVFQRAWSVLTPEKRELLASLLKEVLEHVQNTWAVKD
jgi:DNA-binding MarR family transcriptional regulator